MHQDLLIIIIKAVSKKIMGYSLGLQTEKILHRPRKRQLLISMSHKKLETMLPKQIQEPLLVVSSEKQLIL